MKRIIAVITLFMFLSLLPVRAESAVSFSLSEIECKNNRLVDIEVRAQCDRKLCAATFEFTYDPSVLEFRDAKPCGDAQAASS